MLLNPQGVKEVVLTANESIAVQTEGQCQVYRRLSFPNAPSRSSLLGTVINKETVFGPYASGATIILRARGLPVQYVSGSGTPSTSSEPIQGSGAPTDGVTGAGVAGKAQFYRDYTNADLYINAGTLASPVWKIVPREA